MINLLDFVVKEFGYEKVIAEKKFSFTVKDYPLIHFVISGEGYFEINKRKYNIKKGGLFLIPANCDANYYPDPNNPWEYIWVGFNGLKSQSLLDSANLNLEHPVFFSQESPYTRIFSDLSHCYNEMNEFRDLNLASIMYKLFYQMTVDNIGKSSKKSLSKATLVNKAKEYISNNYQFDIKVKDIAKDISVTPEYLATIFNELEGISTIGFLKKVRMSVAVNYMNSTSLKINQVAKKCGYRSALYFSNDFKKYYGVSPLEYIKSRKENK